MRFTIGDFVLAAKALAEAAGIPRTTDPSQRLTDEIRYLSTQGRHGFKRRHQDRFRPTRNGRIHDS